MLVSVLRFSSHVGFFFSMRLRVVLMPAENFIHICSSVTQRGRIGAACEENMSDRMSEQTGHYRRRPVKSKYLLNHGKCEEEKEAAREIKGFHVVWQVGNVWKTRNECVLSGGLRSPPFYPLFTHPFITFVQQEVRGQEPRPAGRVNDDLSPPQTRRAKAPNAFLEVGSRNNELLVNVHDARLSQQNYGKDVNCGKRTRHDGVLTQTETFLW